MADKHLSDILKDLDKHHSLAINFSQEQDSFIELMRGSYIICAHTDHHKYLSKNTTLNCAKINNYNILLEEQKKLLRPNKLTLHITREGDNKIIYLDGLVSGNNMCLKEYKVIEKHGFEKNILMQQTLNEKIKIIDKQHTNKYTI